MQGDIVTYDYFGGLYINMTNRCDCHCVFCIRDQEASALGGLWLQEEPAKEAVLAEILAQDLGQYTEIVFCGYGEPTCRADDLFWLCDQLRAAGRADLPPIRLNTNGHGSLINHRDITPELKGRLDAVSVSLNGSNREEYLRLTRPGAGEKGWQAMLDFVRHAVQYVPKVMVSIVDYDKSPQEMEACRRLAEELGDVPGAALCRVTGRRSPFFLFCCSGSIPFPGIPIYYGERTPPQGEDGRRWAMKKPKIRLTLVDQKGTMGCHRGHRIGDTFDFDTERGRLCPMAMHVAFPYVDILRYGGTLPARPDGSFQFCCPDVDVINVFRLDVEKEGIETKDLPREEK